MIKSHPQRKIFEKHDIVNKELRNCILCVSRMRLLFCSIRAYLDILVLLVVDKLVLVAILCFLSFQLVLRFEFLWSNGLVVKALDSQSRGPVFKTTGVAPWSTQPFVLPRSIK